MGHLGEVSARLLNKSHYQKDWPIYFHTWKLITA